MKIAAEAEAERVRVAASGVADALKIEAAADADAEKIRAQGRAEGLRAVSAALTAAGGEQAMVQNIAEKYISELANMSKHANLIIVPDKPNDISGVVTTALALGKQVASSK